MARLTNGAKEIVDSAASLAASLGHAEVVVDHVAATLLRHSMGTVWFSILYLSHPRARAAIDERLPTLQAAYRSGPPGAPSRAPVEAWLRAVKRKMRLRDFFRPLNEADLVVAVRDAAELKPLFDAAAIDLTRVIDFERRARAQAASRGDPIVMAEHALLGACLDASFRAPLEKAGIDVDALTVALGRIASSIATSSPTALGKLETLCVRACIRAGSSHSQTATPDGIIIDMLRNQSMSERLSRAGFDPFDLVYALVHARPQTTSHEPSDAASLVLHNDDHTTMEFVTESLSSVLGWEREEATALMQRVHEHGQAVIELTDRDEASRALRAFHERAREKMMPLRVEMSAQP
jgi:ATP-dependent Clp protease adaptor protein ClpS